jgi:cobalamin biosynthesis protein CobD/CbiB
MLMLTQILSTQKTLTKLIAKNSPQTNWSIEIAHFNLLLSCLQHERLIHLLVTLTVGLATLISYFVTLFHPLLTLYLLDFILSLLFVVYIFHYRRLENTTQNCYPLLEELHKQLTKS